jgi:hypothetical protein
MARQEYRETFGPTEGPFVHCSEELRLRIVVNLTNVHSSLLKFFHITKVVI